MKRRWNNDLEKPEAACNGTHPTEKNAKISFTCRFHRKRPSQYDLVFFNEIRFLQNDRMCYNISRDDVVKENKKRLFNN